MGWWEWLIVPLVVLSIFESWLTHHFSEAVYRVGPRVFRREWGSGHLALEETHFKTLAAVFWLSPSGEWLFQPRDLLYQSLPYKGRVRLEDGVVVVEVRIPLFPVVTFAAVLLFLVLQGSIAASSELLLVLPIWGFLIGISYLSARSAVNALGSRLTSLTSASS